MKYRKLVLVLPQHLLDASIGTQAGIGQGSFVTRIHECKSQDTLGRQHGTEVVDQLHHLNKVHVREDREGDDDVELQTAIGYRQISDAFRIVLRTVPIEMNEVSSRMITAPLFDHNLVDVDAPVIIMIHRVSSSYQESADVSSEIQDLALLPCRTFQNCIEIHELGGPSANGIPHVRPQ